MDSVNRFREKVNTGRSSVVWQHQFSGHLPQAGFCPPHTRVAAYWAALRLLIQEVPSSCLHPETDYPDRFFCFSYSFQEDAQKLPEAMKSSILWDVRSCRAVGVHRRFGGTCLQATNDHASDIVLVASSCFLTCLNSWTQNMEAVITSKR